MIFISLCFLSSLPRNLIIARRICVFACGNRFSCNLNYKRIGAVSMSIMLLNRRRLKYYLYILVPLHDVDLISLFRSGACKLITTVLILIFSTDTANQSYSPATVVTAHDSSESKPTHYFRLSYWKFG